MKHTVLSWETCSAALKNWQQATDDPFMDQAYLDKVTAAQIAKQEEIRAYEAEHGKGSIWGKPVSNTDWSDLLHGRAE